MKKHLGWLYGELPNLVASGVLSEGCAIAIKKHYGDVKLRSGRSVALAVCSILGAVLIGAGVILLLAHNWTQLSRPIRTVLAILPLALAQLGGAWCLVKGKSSVAWRESISSLIMLLIGSSIALVGQTYHIPGDTTQFLLVWMVLSLPLVYLFNAVLPCLLYMAGIIGWAGSAQADGGHALFFWVLYAGVLPFVINVMRRDRYSIPSGILGWGLCLQAAWVGITLERVMPGLWIVVYMSMFSALYLVGAYWFDDAPSGWQKPMQLCGAAGVAILSLMLTFEWPWDDVGWRYWHYAYRYYRQAAWMDYALALSVPTVSVCLMVTAFRRGQLWRLVYGSATFLGALGFLYAAANNDEFGCVVAANLYAFVLGVMTVVYGIKNGLIGTINGGMAIISALIIIRFFDEDFSFLFKGLTFIVLGIGFLATNLILVRRMRKEVQL